MTPCLKCGKPATIRCVALDAPTLPERDRTMELCTRHFWDWNAHSLSRRGFTQAGGVVRGLIEEGFLDEAPTPVAYERRML